MSDPITPVVATVAASAAPLLGVLAGFVGVSAAVYLQLVAPHRVPPVYIVVFFVLGSGMILTNIRVLPTVPGELGTVLPIVGNGLVLGLEAVLFWYVANKANVPYPTPDPHTDDRRI